MTDELMTTKEVLEFTRLPRTSFYDLIAAGTFPRGTKLNRRLVVWPRSVVEDWLATKLAEGV